MAKEITIGITGISLQEIDPVTGADVGTAFVFGDTLEDSFTMATDEGTEVTINIEESSDPIYSAPGNTTTSITWQSPNADPEQVAKITGGTWTAEDGYSSPRRRVTKEYAINVTTEQGSDLVFNRVKLTAFADGTFGKNNALTITASGNALVPVTGTKGAWSLTPKAH